MVERSRSIAAAETSTEDGEGVGAAAGERTSRAGTSSLGRGAMGTVGADMRAAGAAAGPAETAEGAASVASSERWVGRAAPLFKPSVSRASSLTTADRPIRMNPPVSAVVPPDISVAPRENSLNGMENPNPIAATPDAATTIPNINKTKAIAPMLGPTCVIGGGNRATMVTN
jgi:hypothetical protein